MAGDWIPYEINLPSKPQLIMLADAAKMKPREVIGLLLEFWAWASSHTSDGFIPALNLHQLQRLFPGTKLLFWQSMADTNVGWLEVRTDGIFIPRAEKWITRGAKARLQKNVRQAKWRQNSDADVDAQPSTTSSTTEQNRTVQNITEHKPTPTPSPADADFVEFWKVYPKKIGKGAAEKAWLKMKSRPHITIILAAIEWQRKSQQWTKDNGQYIPNPATYINQKRWLDEQPQSTTKDYSAWKSK